MIKQHNFKLLLFHQRSFYSNSHVLSFQSTSPKTFHKTSLTPLCSKISVALSFHNPIKATRHSPSLFFYCLPSHIKLCGKAGRVLYVLELYSRIQKLNKCLHKNLEYFHPKSNLGLSLKILSETQTSGMAIYIPWFESTSASGSLKK